MRRRTHDAPGDMTLHLPDLATPLGEEREIGRPVPVRTVRAQFALRLDLGRPAKTDDPRLGIVWEHLEARLRAVAAARPRALAETLAADLMRVLLAEDRVHRAEVRLEIPGGDGRGGALTVRLVRSQTREDSPIASGAFRRKVFAMKVAGSLVKFSARLYHAVRPTRRWRLPEVDPAFGPAPVGCRIPRILWQTNFTAECSLPLWINYRRNRRLSAGFEYRYVSTEAREAYLRRHAPKRVLDAYLALDDGAAQADLWRLFALWREGGVYMDFDAALVRPLGDVLSGREELFVWNRKRFTNYFLASTPGNPVLAKMIDSVVSNVERHPGGSAPGIFYTTGPGAAEPVLDALPSVEYVPCKSCCVQGAFSNERFQYIDRPGGKWTHRRAFVLPRRNQTLPEVSAR